MRRYGPALQPIDDQGREIIGGIGRNEEVRVSITRPRNLDFHRKLFALVRFAFDHYEPEPDQEWEAKWGMTPEKNFDRFRREVIMLAGYTKAHYSVGKDKIIVEPKSISFAAMSEDEFAELYRKVLRVVWKLIFRHINYEDEEAVANALLEFE